MKHEMWDLVQSHQNFLPSTQRKITHKDSTYFDMISNKINHRKKLDKINW